jgi:hypothetical protein
LGIFGNGGKFWQFWKKSVKVGKNRNWKFLTSRQEIGNPGIGIFWWFLEWQNLEMVFFDNFRKWNHNLTIFDIFYLFLNYTTLNNYTRPYYFIHRLSTSYPQFIS